MNDESSISTWHVLREFGFIPNGNPLSDSDHPGLSFDFRLFKLSAIWVWNERFLEIVQFTGVLKTKRTLAMIDFEMPWHLESREQCAAWMVWNLKTEFKHFPAYFLDQYDWIELGKTNEDTLPWYFDRAAYDARPQCTVERRWLRLALNTLSESIKKNKDDEDVTFSFKNKILLIQFGDQIIPAPGKGESWPGVTQVKAANLKKLPKRLMKDPVLIDCWNGKLGIDHWHYPIHGEHTVDPMKNFKWR